MTKLNYAFNTLICVGFMALLVAIAYHEYQRANPPEPAVVSEQPITDDWIACQRCNRPDPLLHATFYQRPNPKMVLSNFIENGQWVEKMIPDDQHYAAALCEKCFTRLSPAQRLVYYKRLRNVWKKFAGAPIDQSGWLTQNLEDWPAIERAVLEGK